MRRYLAIILVIELERLDNLEPIESQKGAYLRGVVFPMDAYWKAAVVGLAPHWRIRVDDRPAGYFAANENKRLLQFYVADPFLPQASELFTFLVSGDLVQSASAGTFEPAYLSHCLDHQAGVATRSYLFQDHRRVTPLLENFPSAHFRPAAPADARRLADFFGRNNEFADDEAVAMAFGDRLNYARALIEQEQAFMLVDGEELLGVGECRISADQPPYADLGMITSHKHRRQGIGAYILARLKETCYERGAEPICSCGAENLPSRKTIEKAGFIPQHRLLDIQFAA